VEHKATRTLILRDFLDEERGSNIEAFRKALFQEKEQMDVIEMIATCVYTCSYVSIPRRKQRTTIESIELRALAFAIRPLAMLAMLAMLGRPLAVLKARKRLLQCVEALSPRASSPSDVEPLFGFHTALVPRLCSRAPESDSPRFMQKERGLSQWPKVSHMLQMGKAWQHERVRDRTKYITARYIATP
jgi:hypothetical protein